MKKIIAEIKQLLNLETDTQLLKLLRIPKAVMSRIQKNNRLHEDLQAKRALIAVGLILRRLNETEINQFKNDLIELEIADLKQNFNLAEK